MVTSLKRRKVLGSLLVGGLTQGCGGGAAGSSSSSPPAPATAIPLATGTPTATPPATDSVALPVTTPTEKSADSAAPAAQQPSGAAANIELPTTPAAEPVAVAGPKLAALALQPLYIAHRGGSAPYPEETLIAYDQCVQDGALLLESDLQMTRDGTPVLMHDGSVDRTTTASGTIAAMSDADWMALRIDANSWHGSNYGNALHAPTFKEWVQRYRGKVIFVPEIKDERALQAMLAILGGLQVDREQVLVQSFSLTQLQTVQQAGYTGCLLDNGTGNPQAAFAAGIKWAGISNSASDAVLKEWVGSGLKVLQWTVSRRFQRDAGLAAGVAGFFSDDPVYLRASKALASSDQFASGTWAPGMLGNGSDTALNLRGEFFSGGYWGYSSNRSDYLGCLHGYLGPFVAAAQARRVTISMKISFDSLSNDAFGFASIFLGVDDKPFLNGNESSAGYHLILRKNGVIEIHRKALLANAAVLTATGGAPIADGEEVRYRIDLTDDSVSVARIGSDGTAIQTAQARDATYHVGYLHLGRGALACRFRQLSVQPG